MLHVLFFWLGHSALGRYMQTSQWAFAIVETVHLLALAALGGSVLMIDLRLLGVILRDHPARTIARSLERLLVISLIVMIASGIGLLSEEAMKCYFSPAFRWKMALLISAVLFYFTVHRNALKQSDGGTPTARSRAIAGMSMGLWLGVGVAGRLIGLL